jgi:hypothetical protein
MARRKPHGYAGQVCRWCRRCSRRAYLGAYLENMTHGTHLVRRPAARGTRSALATRPIRHRTAPASPELDYMRLLNRD